MKACLTRVAFAADNCLADGAIAARVGRARAGPDLAIGASETVHADAPIRSSPPSSAVSAVFASSSVMASLRSSAAKAVRTAATSSRATVAVVEAGLTGARVRPIAASRTGEPASAHALDVAAQTLVAQTAIAARPVPTSGQQSATRLYNHLRRQVIV